MPHPNEDYDDNLAEVTGWGLNDPNFPYPTEDLMTVNVTTILNLKCQELVENITFGQSSLKISSNEICAMDVGKSPCYGDSGGPMITLSEDGSYYSQIGVVSWGIGCATATPGVYSRVTQQLYWIIKQISGQTCAPPNF